MRPYKASTEQYRTIAGERYICWTSNPAEHHARAYRQAGIKCVVRGIDFYVRESDKDKAVALWRFLSQAPV